MEVFKTNLFLVFLIILFFKIHKAEDQDDCITDSDNITICSIEKGKEINQNLNINYSPIKIKVDYTYSNQPESMQKETFLKLKSLIDETALEFQKFLKVRHIIEKDLKEEINFIKGNCSLTEFNENFLDSFKENDIVIFIFLKSLKSTTLASSRPCYYDNNNRPIFGLIYININHNKMKEAKFDRFIKEVLLHEMTHILVFYTPLLYKL